MLLKTVVIKTINIVFDGNMQDMHSPAHQSYLEPSKAIICLIILIETEHLHILSIFTCTSQYNSQYFTMPKKLLFLCMPHC